jgi:hypothetical protein
VVNRRIWGFFWADLEFLEVGIRFGVEGGHMFHDREYRLVHELHVCICNSVCLAVQVAAGGVSTSY